MSAATRIETRHPCGCTGPSTATGAGCSCGCGGCGACSPGPTTARTGTAEATERAGTAAAPGLAARPRFFPGELVTDDDLDAAVAYHRRHENLSNAAIGGWGVYCGYALVPDAKSCRLTVGPGVAYDACGRALVHCGVMLEEPGCGEAGTGKLIQDGRLQKRQLWLAVAYDDCYDEARPRYGTPCGPTADPGCDYARVRERVRFVWLDEEPPREYWVSGCLPDPCAPPAPEPDEECRVEVPEGEEQLLDRCTPDIGARGGLGVLRYRQALVEHWNLHRNTSVAFEPHGDCHAELGAILDVIGGRACAPCHGEPLVVLARVTFGPPQSPSIEVEPVRRRVLSNADLTYLLYWMFAAITCPAERPRPVLEESLPLASVLCGTEKTRSPLQQAQAVARWAIGRPHTNQQREEVVKGLLYLSQVQGVRVEELPGDRIARVIGEALGERLGARHVERMGRLAREPARVERIQASIDALLAEAEMDPARTELAPLRWKLTELAFDRHASGVRGLPPGDWQAALDHAEAEGVPLGARAREILVSRAGPAPAPRVLDETRIEELSREQLEAALRERLAAERSHEEEEDDDEGEGSEERNSGKSKGKSRKSGRRRTKREDD